MFCDLSNFLHIIAGIKDEVPLQHGLMVYRRLWGWVPYCLNLYEWRWVVGSALQLFLRAVVSINCAVRWSLDDNFEFPSRSASLCSTRSLLFYWIEVPTDKVGESSECFITNLTRLQMVYRVMWNPVFTSRFLTFEYRTVARYYRMRKARPSLDRFFETRKCITDLLYRISPKSDNKCGKYRQKFI
jgi:hypothetical protein